MNWKLLHSTTLSQRQWDHINLQQFLLCPLCGLLALPAWEQHKACGTGLCRGVCGSCTRTSEELLLLPGLGCFSHSVSLSIHSQALSVVSPHVLVLGPLCPACGKLTTGWLSLFTYLWWGLCHLSVCLSAVNTWHFCFIARVIDCYMCESLDTFVSF